MKMIIEVLFYVFAAMIVLPVLYLMVTKNIIRAAFALVITLLGIAALYVLLQADFMAVVQLLMYAGGVIVLLIFGIMLTRRISGDGVFTEQRSILVGGVLSIGLLALLIRWLSSAALEWNQSQAVQQDQVKSIGVLFLTDHLLAFELIAFLLLVALIGASLLAKISNVS